MVGKDAWSFAKLESSRHDRVTFDCGVPALNSYIQNTASQHQRRDTNQIHVATLKIEPDKVIGYYGLATGAVAYEELPKDEQDGLSPVYPIPVIYLTRLAADISYHGQGLGGSLLMDCYRSALKIREEAGARYLIVDAKDGKAKAFYEKYQFTPFQGKPLKLYRSMKAIAEL